MPETPRKASARLPVGPAREATIQRLCAAYASDALDGEEFERRLDLAYRAATDVELRTLTADLPAPAEAAPAAGPPALGRAETASRAGSQVVIAVMGAAERRGGWVPARRIYTVGFMGGAELDFREARFAPGETEVYVLALMGGVSIVVPPGVAVETEGVGVMGGFEHLAQPANPDGPQAPRLRIRGLALMGGVEVTVRLPGESARDARRRLRDAASLRIEVGRER